MLARQYKYILTTLTAVALILGIALPGGSAEVPPDYYPPPQQTPPPTPVYVAPQPVQVVLPAAPPQFVYVPELGYYVAMGVANDMLYDGSYYYYHNNGYWYRTAHYGEPWVHLSARLLPSIFVGFNVREVHRHRDIEFVRYQRERERYRGQLHRPEVRRIERKEERRREERREEHEHR